MEDKIEQLKLLNIRINDMVSEKNRLEHEIIELDDIKAKEFMVKITCMECEGQGQIVHTPVDIDMGLPDEHECDDCGGWGFTYQIEHEKNIPQEHVKRCWEIAQK